MQNLFGRWQKRVLVMLSIVGWCAILVSALPASTAAQSRQEPTTRSETSIVRIRAATEQDSLKLNAEGIDVLEMRDGKDLFAVVTSAEIERLRKAGFDVRIDAGQTAQMIESVQRFTVQGGYRTVEEGQALLNTWQSTYPNLAQAFTYGVSWDKQTAGGPTGYDLRAITLTNKLIAGPKPTFVLISSIHAREMATAEVSLRFADYLLSRYGTDPDVTWLLNEHQVVIFPFMNPDGRKNAEAGIYQRKNKNTVTAPCSSQTSSSQPGIDLNRNSNFYWGTVNSPTQAKCSATYPGPSAASEPEVRSLETWLSRVFIDQRGPNDTDPAPTTARDIFISLHAYSDLVLWPYGWTNALAPNDADLAGLGRKFATYNNYTAQKSTALYPTSGATDDWTYGVFGVASYTFEIGPESGGCSGFFPAFTCLDSGTGGNFWGRNLPALLYATKVARTPYLLHRGPDSLTPSVSAISGGYRVSATVNDTKNGNQTVNAAEMYLNTPPWKGGTPIAMTATDGSFNATSEAVQGTITSPPNGQNLVYVRGRDASGNWGPFSAVFLNATVTTGGISGRVTTSDNGASAVGVTVSATSGSTTVTAVTDANGNYTMNLAAGTYSVSGSGTNFVTSSAVNQTVSSSFVTYNFAIVEKANLSVPTSLGLSAIQGGSTSQALNVSNQGGQSLTAAVSVAPADYAMTSSGTAGGPTYSWTEINTTGTRRALGDDACLVVNLAQPFTFYGTAYTSIGVHSNGFVTMGTSGCPASGDVSTNPTIPSSATPNGVIAAMWDDLDPSVTSGTNGIFTLDDTTNKRVIIEYKNVPHYNSAGSAETFQIILDRNAGDITFNYQTVATAGSATTGIETTAGTSGLLWSYNTASKLYNSLSVRFQYFSSGAGWLSFTPSSLSVAARGSSPVQVTGNAASLTAGVYRARLKLDAGTAINGVQYVPVTLNVTTALNAETLDVNLLKSVKR